ncbi:hypothetical protein FBUS_06022 [Fasciolopsis buskii]|uniref:Uncharacterized protein n=1 Tax=Fasciolopsis buskii TaxID=27845 RepID=A0A8E0RP34_9TREM|nr:hypothetical protein FBUS_06022 [Fasciolopsis buski]
MVYSIARLDSMYAPSMIGQVLDFVLPCYAAARPPISGNSETRSLVSTLRPSSSVQVNEALIERTTELIKESSPIGSYHLVWENRDVMDDFLHRLGYELVFCGTESVDKQCDWSKMGVPQSVAKSLCLYRWINHSTFGL